MSKILIAAVQLTSGPNVNKNLAVAEKLICKATKSGAKLILLPELFCGLFPPSNKPKEVEIAEKYLDYSNSPIQSFLRQTAIKNQIWLAAGSIPLVGKTKNKVRNSLLIFNPQGDCICRYDKIHLFKFEDIDENKLFEAGNRISHLSIKINNLTINICPSICYDLRFPELYRFVGKKFARAGSRGIDIILMPVAFTYKTGKAHWRKLLQARAIENQCYVLAAAQSGKHLAAGKVFRKTYGNSMIVNPWGKIVAKIKEGEGIVISQFDPIYIKQLRHQLPALEHQKII